MGSEMKPIYFFHIPKTSGRFFTINTIFILEHEFLIRGIDYSSVLNGFGHLSFKPVDDNDLIGITFLREPVSRTVSHYLHILNNQLSDDINDDKKKMIKFLQENPENPIIDYQTKYMIYSGDSKVIDIYCEEFYPKALTNDDLNFAKDRLSKIDFIFDTNQQGADLVQKMKTYMYDHFEISVSKDVESLNLQYPPIANPQSKILYDSLTLQEKSEIENLLPYDMEIYNSTSFSVV